MHSHGIDMDGSVSHIFLLAKEKSYQIFHTKELHPEHYGILGASNMKRQKNIYIETYPLSICFAILKPRARFSVKTALERPYSVSFAISIASSSLEISMMETEGPKDSV